MSTAFQRGTGEAEGKSPRMARRSFWGYAFRQLIRNRMSLIGGIFIILMALTAIFAPWIAPKGYEEGNLVDNYARPGAKFLLGADFMGRDLLSRIIYGSRVSLTVGVVGATMATIIG
ncbi:MAG: hypothetical protein AAB303_03545, partial [Chloroflexota bacterium]